MKEQIYTLGSLFDGIGGFPYAASFYGIKTLWASEIIPATISITRRHFPDMEHLGDITKLSGGELTPVDIITFGSPCQSFSIAGGRKGLEGKSGLFWEAIRIIREMREATNERKPQFSVFENVPGILSANRGSDYKTVLEAFTETEIPFPPSGRWTNAGMVRGGRIDFAWIIHDAQYFGVAQRRRRLFAVCDFTGQRAAEILFKPKSLHWYFAEGGKAREGTATDTEGRADGTEFTTAGGSEIASALSEQNCLTPWDAQARRIYEKNGVWPTLYGGVGGGRDYVTADTVDCNNPVALTCAAFLGGQSATAGSIAYSEKVSPTLKSGASGTNMVPCVCETILRAINKSSDNTDGSEGAAKVYCLCADSSNSMRSDNPKSGIYESDTSRTLDRNGGNPVCNQGGMLIIAPHDSKLPCICEPQIARTLTARGDSGPCVDRGQNIVAIGINGGVAGTLDASYYKGVGERCGVEREVVLCAATGQSNAEILKNLSATLNCNCEQPIVCHPKIAGTLCGSGAGLSRPAGMGSETDFCVVTGNTPCHAAYGFDMPQITSKTNGSSLKEIQPVLCKTGRPHVVIKTEAANDKAAVSDVTVYCLQGSMIGRKDKNGPNGDGINENVCFTISVADRHAVAAVDCRNLRETEELSGTLQAKSNGSYSLNYTNPVRTGYIVRRLTPTECERLQGYIDGWTEYGHDGKPLCDTARYQALGNSVAIPCVAYVISGIVDALIEADATLKEDCLC